MPRNQHALTCPHRINRMSLSAQQRDQLSLKFQTDRLDQNDQRPTRHARSRSALDRQTNRTC